MPIIPFEDSVPELGPNVFIAPDAWIIGRVSLAAHVSIFFGAVLRGDIERIAVGANSNLQEHAAVHTSPGLECRIGANVTIGHGAILHSCTIQDNCVIGMGATILDGAVIGGNSIVGAQALVKMNMEVPPGSLVIGVPAKVERQLSAAEVAQIEESAKHYKEKGRQYFEYLTRCPIRP